VVDENDLVGAEQTLADDQRPDLVVGDDSARIANHVGVAFGQAQQSERVQPCIHTGDDRYVEPRRHRQPALVKANFVGAGILEQVIGNAHRCPFTVL
jgi:hypothetical protein